MKWFKKLLLPALNRPSTATLISSCPADARALASNPDRAEIWYRAATSAARPRAACKGEVESMRAGRGLEGEESIQPARYLTTSTLHRTVPVRLWAVPPQICS